MVPKSAQQARVFEKVGLLGSLRTRPDLADDAITIETLIKRHVIHGSPYTVCDQLAVLA
jgi:hypothetical protein